MLGVRSEESRFASTRIADTRMGTFWRGKVRFQTTFWVCRLLELLWNMLLSGEAQGEILESNSFVEILQYYDSVKRADKQVRCI